MKKERADKFRELGVAIEGFEAAINDIKDKAEVGFGVKINKVAEGKIQINDKSVKTNDKPILKSPRPQ